MANPLVSIFKGGMAVVVVVASTALILGAVFIVGPVLALIGTGIIVILAMAVSSAGVYDALKGEPKDEEDKGS